MKPGYCVSKCAILADPRDPERHEVIEKAVQELVPELERLAISTEVFLKKTAEDPEPKGHFDLYIVMGGDGAMIQFVGKLGHNNTPFYGLNYGHVGFMMNSPGSDLGRHAQRLKNGSFATRSFPLLHVVSTDLKDRVHHSYGLNDIYLQRMTPQSCKVNMTINGGALSINPILCDGLIVSTPLGSTSYSYNITGSLMDIETPVITLTPIAANRSCPVSSLVLPQNAQLSFEILEPVKRRVQVVSDGQSHGDVTHATVATSEKKVQLCFTKNSESLSMRFLNKAFGSF